MKVRTFIAIGLALVLMAGCAPIPTLKPTPTPAPEIHFGTEGEFYWPASNWSFDPKEGDTLEIEWSGPISATDSLGTSYIVTGPITLRFTTEQEEP